MWAFARAADAQRKLVCVCVYTCVHAQQWSIDVPATAAVLTTAPDATADAELLSGLLP